jgi:hypothetical protein
MKKALRYISATLLLTGIVFIMAITYMNYKVIPIEVYKLDTLNNVKDNGFESFDQSPGDCCTTPEKAKEARIFAFKSNDAFEGDYSLSLISENHCACVDKPLIQFKEYEKYLVSFYYKGEQPRFCNWVQGDNLCLPEAKLNPSEKWKRYNGLFIVTNKSTSSAVVFYADSDGTKTVTNLYDDLQVRKLISIKPSLSPDDYKQDQEYVIKTNPTNVVNAICAKQYKDSEGKCPVERLSDDGYYLVRGAPQVNLKFPWTELILIIIMMLIIIRLLFRKQVIKAGETFEYELKKGLKKFR